MTAAPPNEVSSLGFDGIPSDRQDPPTSNNFGIRLITGLTDGISQTLRGFLGPNLVGIATPAPPIIKIPKTPSKFSDTLNSQNSVAQLQNSFGSGVFNHVAQANPAVTFPQHVANNQVVPQITTNNIQLPFNPQVQPHLLQQNSHLLRGVQNTQSNQQGAQNNHNFQQGTINTHNFQQGSPNTQNFQQGVQSTQSFQNFIANPPSTLQNFNTQSNFQNLVSPLPTHSTFQNQINLQKNLQKNLLATQLAHSNNTPVNLNNIGSGAPPSPTSSSSLINTQNPFKNFGQVQKPSTTLSLPNHNSLTTTTSPFASLKTFGKTINSVNHHDHHHHQHHHDHGSHDHHHGQNHGSHEHHHGHHRHGNNRTLESTEDLLSKLIVSSVMSGSKNIVPSETIIHLNTASDEESTEDLSFKKLPKKEMKQKLHFGGWVGVPEESFDNNQLRNTNSIALSQKEFTFSKDIIRSTTNSPKLIFVPSVKLELPYKDSFNDGDNIIQTDNSNILSKDMNQGKLFNQIEESVNPTLNETPDILSAFAKFRTDTAQGKNLNVGNIQAKEEWNNSNKYNFGKQLNGNMFNEHSNDISSQDIKIDPFTNFQLGDNSQSTEDSGTLSFTQIIDNADADQVREAQKIITAIPSMNISQFMQTNSNGTHVFDTELTLKSLLSFRKKPYKVDEQIGFNPTAPALSFNSFVTPPNIHGENNFNNKQGLKFISSTDSQNDIVYNNGNKSLKNIALTSSSNAGHNEPLWGRKRANSQQGYNQIQQSNLQQSNSQKKNTQQHSLPQKNLQQTLRQENSLLNQGKWKQNNLQDNHQVNLQKDNSQENNLPNLQLANLHEDKSQQGNSKTDIFHQANFQQGNSQPGNLKPGNLQQGNSQQRNLQQGNSQQGILQATLQQSNLQNANLMQLNLQQGKLTPDNLKQENMQQSNLQQPILSTNNLQQGNSHRNNIQQNNSQQSNVQHGKNIQEKLQQGNLQKENLPQANSQHGKWHLNNFQKGNMNLNNSPRGNTNHGQLNYGQLQQGKKVVQDSTRQSSNKLEHVQMSNLKSNIHHAVSFKQNINQQGNFFPGNLPQSNLKLPAPPIPSKRFTPPPLPHLHGIPTREVFRTTTKPATETPANIKPTAEVFRWKSFKNSLNAKPLVESPNGSNMNMNIENNSTDNDGKSLLWVPNIQNHVIITPKPNYQFGQHFIPTVVPESSVSIQQEPPITWRGNVNNIRVTQVPVIESFANPIQHKVVPATLKPTNLFQGQLASSPLEPPNIPAMDQSSFGQKKSEQFTNQGDLKNEALFATPARQFFGGQESPANNPKIIKNSEKQENTNTIEHHLKQLNIKHHINKAQQFNKEEQFNKVKQFDKVEQYDKIEQFDKGFQFLNKPILAHPTAIPITSHLRNNDAPEDSDASSVGNSRNFPNLYSTSGNSNNDLSSSQTLPNTRIPITRYQNPYKTKVIQELPNTQQASKIHTNKPNLFNSDQGFPRQNLKEFSNTQNFKNHVHPQNFHGNNPSTPNQSYGNKKINGNEKLESPRPNAPFTPWPSNVFKNSNLKQSITTKLPISIKEVATPKFFGNFRWRSSTTTIAPDKSSTESSEPETTSVSVFDAWVRRSRGIPVTSATTEAPSPPADQETDGKDTNSLFSNSHVGKTRNFPSWTRQVGSGKSLQNDEMMNVEETEMKPVRVLPERADGNRQRRRRRRRKFPRNNPENRKTVASWRRENEKRIEQSSEPNKMSGPLDETKTSLPELSDEIVSQLTEILKESTPNIEDDKSVSGKKSVRGRKRRKMITVKSRTEKKSEASSIEDMEEKDLIKVKEDESVQEEGKTATTL